MYFLISGFQGWISVCVYSSIQPSPSSVLKNPTCRWLLVHLGWMGRADTQNNICFPARAFTPYSGKKHNGQILNGVWHIFFQEHWFWNNEEQTISGMLGTKTLVCDKIGTWLKTVSPWCVALGIQKWFGGDLYLCHILVQQVISLKNLCSHDGVGGGRWAKHHLKIYLWLKWKLNVGRVLATSECK